jgi:hypothetical protein
MRFDNRGERIDTTNAYTYCFFSINTYIIAFMKTYIKPTDVLSPKRHWVLVHVLFDGGEEGSSLAIGRWDDKPVLAMRWNGHKESPMGNPQSRGLPTWFVVPEEHRRAVFENEPFMGLRPDTISFAQKFLEMRKFYFLAPCLTPGCLRYEQPVLHDYSTKNCPERLKELEQNKLELYCMFCDISRRPTHQEKENLLRLLHKYCPK